jgi:MFS family permease
MPVREAEPGMRAQFMRIIAGYICLHAALAGTRMAAPLMALHLGYDKRHIGALLALFALTQVFLSLPAGRLADCHGLRLPFGLCIAAASAGAGIAALSSGYGGLCVSALFIGGSVGTAAIAMQRHVGRAAQSPAELKKMFSWLSMAPAVSNFLGPFAAGLIIDHAGYRCAFLFLAALPFAGWLWLRKVAEAPRKPTPGAGAGTAWTLWREAGFRRLLLINLLVSASWDLHTFMVPVLGHARGLQASAVGSVLGAFAVAAAIARFAMPVVSGWLREWVLISGAMVTAGFVFGLYPFTPSALAMGMCSAVLGLALGAVQPMVMSALYQITPVHRQGEAVAMRIMMINASSVAMPLLFGAAGGVMAVSGVFWTMGLVVGLGGRLGLGLRGMEEGGTHR